MPGRKRFTVFLLAELSQMDTAWDIGCDSSSDFNPHRNGRHEIPQKKASGARPVVSIPWVY
jgi:hypothetical protein